MGTNPLGNEFRISSPRLVLIVAEVSEQFIRS